ncbi:MAG TPA: radical SAM protein [Ignisphaera sp.]|uniref:Radical SAM protein n=1 Tax=Ignisphaera aggregans TaxID=334771 RepID=A0A832YXZ2_9CREN|nr:radical SAM protein [Ignisphaera sp.]HIP56996.1 radical SAM protein [Ignisphaera aggregans]
MTIVFGPVPSRRLGTSLGINNIPYKYCTYSCVYCQLGKTTNITIVRRDFYNPEKAVKDVKQIVSKLSERIDYITFVPDGEPTLDKNLGQTIRLLKREIDIPIAVITNGSLLWREDVLNDIIEADLISVKVDAGDEDTWRKINRPHQRLNFNKVLKGLNELAKRFTGVLITETMLVKNLNTHRNIFEKVLDVLSVLTPHRAYIAIPIRPPTEEWVEAPSTTELSELYNLASSRLGKNRVHLLDYPEPSRFIMSESIDSVKEYVLSMIEVHPLSMDHLSHILAKKNIDMERFLKELLDEDLINIVEYKGRRFIVRKRKTELW